MNDYSFKYLLEPTLDYEPSMSLAERKANDLKYYRDNKEERKARMIEYNKEHKEKLN